MTELPVPQKLEKIIKQTREISQEKYNAIQYSIRIGRQLINDHPEMADMYREGMSHPKIAEILEVKVNHGIFSDGIAVSSIGYAIKGHDGSFGVDAYGGLIQDEDELRRLKYEHAASLGRINGINLAKLGLGCHGINSTTGEKYSVEGGRKGGIKGGRKVAGLINQKTGLRFVVEGGIKGILAQGKTPWTEEEREHAYLLSLDSEYKYQKGKRIIPDIKKIVEILNNTYHNSEDIRNVPAVRNTISRYKKSLGK